MASGLIPDLVRAIGRYKTLALLGALWNDIAMREQPQSIIQGITTKSDMIRALHAANYSRTEIAQFLNIRYQHVRNVLVSSRLLPESKLSNAEPTSAPVAIEPEIWTMQRLIAAGFTIVAECEAAGDSAFSYTALAPKVAGVYAFAVDGIITYVGLTRSGLRTRLGQYIYGHAQQRTSAPAPELRLRFLRRWRAENV